MIKNSMSKHDKFVLLVQTYAMAMDIIKGVNLADIYAHEVVGKALELDSSVLPVIKKNGKFTLSGLAKEFCDYCYGLGRRPAWLGQTNI